MLTLGLLVNPLAGIGGPAAMKGSDGAEVQRRALELGVEPLAIQRARSAFSELAVALEQMPEKCCRIITLPGAMGSDAVAPVVPAGVFRIEIVDDVAVPDVTTAQTTVAGVRALAAQVDLLVFVGGDGTARDILDGLSLAQHEVPVMGIPAGVKMHSGVFATSPGSAAKLLALLVEGGLVAAHLAEVKDIDEAALRRGEVGSTRYGELLVPTAGGYLQHVKSGGKEVEALVLLEIAAEVEESVGTDSAEPDVRLVLGPGSTCFAVKQQLLAGQEPTGPAPTLLGVDVICRGAIVHKDITAAGLEALQSDAAPLEVFVSFSRGQGFVLGRGNQQLSPIFLDRLPAAALHILSSRTKLASLEGRPLLIDSGSAHIDQKFSGLRSIISGYQDRLLYLVQSA